MAVAGYGASLTGKGPSWIVRSSSTAIRRAAITAVLLASSATGPAAAEGLHWDGSHERDLSAWEWQYSPYTYHLSNDPSHTNVRLLGVARIGKNGEMTGGAYFINSFGQPCWSAFVGHKYVEPWGWKNVYWTWTAGVMYGYKPPFDKKVPINIQGFSPFIVPAIGRQLTPDVAAQVALLGNSGVMFSLVFDVGRRTP